jgi:GNAT superfamily N-acetyltransferase
MRAVNEVEIRPAGAPDLDAILALLQVTHRRGDDPRFADLFRWKHLENAFGASPMWVACDAGRVIGFRVFMPWEFERAGVTRRAVRAVDTATHPDYQGRGIFTQLTRQALDDVAEQGIDFVFNTPNDQSRPGYLKMGWQVAGRAPATFRPTRLRSAATLRGARTAAAHWSEPSEIGIPADMVLADGAALEELLAARRPAPQLRTRATVATLRWRYGMPLLDYRAVLRTDDVRDGCAFVRIRRRGTAREAALVELLVPEGSSARELVRRVLRACEQEVDLVLAIGAVPGFLPLPKIGPIVTTRSAASTAPASIREFALSLGDVELF